MNLRATGKYAIGALALPALMTLAALPSHAQTNSASHVTAEMTKGKLSPAESKPGDMVAIKLKDDVRSNGEVVLKKGTTITGVVRNVAKAMMEIEWIVPPAQGRAVQSVSFTLQSVMQVNPVLQHEQSEAFADEFGLAASAADSSAVPRSAHNGASLLGSATTAVSTVSATTTPSTMPSGRSNVALLSMPSVVAVDQQSGAAIESALGTSSSGQLFRVGHGELISAGGSKQSVDLYSHLSNDTVITSPGKNFEISSGAQMQMLVGVNRK